MYTLASELFHTHWSRGALCEISSWCTLRGPSWFAPHVSMCWMLRSCNPSWFVCNIFVCRRSTACAFICQCHWGSSSAPSFWILSCTLDENIAQALLHCYHRHLLYLVLIALLLPLLRGISFVYSTEHIPKYSSIEKFMKLPFQRVVIRFKRSPNEGVVTVSLLALRAV